MEAAAVQSAINEADGDAKAAVRELIPKATLSQAVAEREREIEVQKELEGLTKLGQLRGRGAAAGVDATAVESAIAD